MIVIHQIDGVIYINLYIESFEKKIDKLFV